MILHVRSDGQTDTRTKNYNDTTFFFVEGNGDGMLTMTQERITMTAKWYFNL